MSSEEKGMHPDRRMAGGGKAGIPARRMHEGGGGSLQNAGGVAADGVAVRLLGWGHEKGATVWGRA